MDIWIEIGVAWFKMDKGGRIRWSFRNYESVTMILASK